MQLAVGQTSPPFNSNTFFGVVATALTITGRALTASADDAPGSDLIIAGATMAWLVASTFQEVAIRAGAKLNNLIRKCRKTPEKEESWYAMYIRIRDEMDQLATTEGASDVLIEMYLGTWTKIEAECSQNAHFDQVPFFHFVFCFLFSFYFLSAIRSIDRCE